MTVADTTERKTAIVGSEDGMYQTLDLAIEHVEEFTTIYLNEGVYEINVPIRKRGLIFEKKDTDKQVFIIGNEGPTIKV